MQKFSFEKTRFEGVVLIKPFISDDDRGSFIKDYNVDTFKQNGINHDLKEVFYTISKKGVVRAIHFQTPHEQAKLVRCVNGKVFDVVVDLRPESKTFGEYISFELSSENNHQLLIPEHFGHGYLVLEDSIVSYKCNEVFVGEDDDGILWNDKDINVDWPVNLVEDIILSEKDKNLQTFSDFKKKVQS